MLVAKFCPQFVGFIQQDFLLLSGIGRWIAGRWLRLVPKQQRDSERCQDDDSLEHVIFDFEKIVRHRLECQLVK